MKLSTYSDEFLSTRKKAIEEEMHSLEQIMLQPPISSKALNICAEIVLTRCQKEIKAINSEINNRERFDRYIKTGNFNKLKE